MKSKPEATTETAEVKIITTAHGLKAYPSVLTVG